MSDAAAVGDASRGRAGALDAADDLAGFRDRFVIADPAIVYLDGNSMGRLPKSSVDLLRGLVDRGWGDRLVRGWDEGWMELAASIGDLIGTGLLGARPGEVVVGDSTTVNFYKLCSAAAAARPGRTTIVTDRDNFPTDRYVAEGVAAANGLRLRWIDGDMVEGPQPADVSAALDESVALLTLSHVAYRTAAIADMAAITSIAHETGALTLWDVSHAVGSVPVDLTGTGADLAVGCTYKYLNGGPGSPAFLYVRSELQSQLRQPIWGWLGRRDPFEMAQGFDPAAGLTAFLSGTPPILSLAPVEVGVRMLVEVGLDRLRAKGIALTEYAIELFDQWLSPLGFVLGCPRDPARRGSHVLFRHQRGQELYEALLRRGVVADFREPQGIRVGLAALTTRFVDVHDGLATLAELAS